MPLCLVRIALEMRLLHSCGKPNTNLGMYLVPSQLDGRLTSAGRNHVPWTIIGICYGICMLLLLAIRVGFLAPLLIPVAGYHRLFLVLFTSSEQITGG